MESESGAAQVLLTTDRLSVTFGALQAVRDVCLEVRGGDLLGLIGPNGAGKTTLMRAICGLQPLTRGNVTILQSPLDGDRSVLQNIGFTPDTPPVYDNLTVRQFLQFIAMGYDLSRAEADERIGFWLEKVWLSEKKDQKIKHLSRGMRQRVGIARTLLPNPPVILLDEPAAGLDPVGRAQFRQLLLDLRQQGKAIIVSSHILSDMDEYCTHIGIMSAGVMTQLGTVAQIAQGAHGDRCRYTALLAKPILQAAKLLEQIPNLGTTQIESDRLVLEYATGRDAAATLLAQLMRLGVSVAGFSVNAANLEEAYLRTHGQQVE